MIAEAKSRERPFDTILVWKYSRFARIPERGEASSISPCSGATAWRLSSVNGANSECPFGTLIEAIIDVDGRK
jgi:hypothetical protein